MGTGVVALGTVAAGGDSDRIEEDRCGRGAGRFTQRIREDAG